MRRQYLLFGIIVLLIMASGLLLVMPGPHAIAHIGHDAPLKVQPTPTPDANQVLDEAKQEETNIQTFLTIITIMLVLFPLLITVASIVLGFFGVRGFRDFQKEWESRLGKVENEWHDRLGKMENEWRDHVLQINQLEQEAKDKQAAIVRTQQALVYLGLGDRLYNQKDSKNAAQAYRKVRSLLPDDPQINYVLGRIFSSDGCFDDAIESFEAALKVQNDLPEVEMELGLAYRRRGEYQKGPNADVRRTADYEKAVAHLQRATQLSSNQRASFATLSGLDRPEDTFATLGGLYRRKGDYEKALDHYEQAYRINPNSSYALGNVASLCWYLGKVDKAREYYMHLEALAKIRLMTPHLEEYWDYYDLALAQLVLGKTDEAKSTYKQAIEKTPSVIQFDSALDVLTLLQKAKDSIPGLNDAIEMLEQARVQAQ
jgi:tetratricopeptide (TPR) repeat protein